MNLLKTSLVTAPAVEPVNLTDVKSHLRISSTAEDSLLNGFISGARQRIEAITNRKLINQTWKVYYDDWPIDDCLTLPYTPLSTGTAPIITYEDAEKTSYALSSTAWRSDSVTEPPRLCLEYNDSWPTVTLNKINPISAQFVCGYSTASSSAVPESIQIALKMIVGHWYENREEYAVGYGGMDVKEIPGAVNALLAPYRIWSF